MNDIDFQLIARYFAGTCTESEKEDFERWMAADPLHREQIETLRQIWNAPKRKRLDVDMQAAWKTLLSQATTPNGPARERTKPRLLPFTLPAYSSHLKFAFRIAAAIILLVGLPYLFFQYSGISFDFGKKQTFATREIVADKGQRVRVLFGDGTKVILNSTSVLRFPERFAGSTREVSLQGEAYFEVARNEDAPFIVRTGDAVVRVLGTGFNVRAWPDDKSVEVVVAHGKVSVRSEWIPTSNEVILTKGLFTNVPQGEQPKEPEKIDVKSYLAWTEGRLEFRRTPLADALRQLERKYDARFEVTDSSLLSKPLTATVKKESLKEVAQLLALALNARYEMKDGIVKLRK